MKPESSAERQIREAMARGELDTGHWHGKPIPGQGEHDDELWWVRRKLREEDVAYLPPQLAIRQEVDEARRRIAAATTEDDVRSIVEEINARIRHVNRTTVGGPPTTVAPLDVDDVVDRWRDR